MEGRRLVTRILPWVVAAGVIAWILNEYSLERILVELRSGDALAAVAPALVASFVVLALVSVWDWLVFRALGASTALSYGNVLAAKGGTSMLQVLGYGFGQGGYGVWLARRTGLPIAPTTGTMIYVASCDLAAVCVVASVAAWFGHSQLDSPAARAHVAAVGTVAPIIAGVVIAGLLLGPVLLRARRDTAFFWMPWARVSPGRALVNVAGRAVNICTATLCTWWGAQAFGLDVPLSAVAVVIPIALVVGSLPVNVGGFGAVQGVWLLFMHWGQTGERILAFNFVWHVLVVIGLVLRGLPFLRRVVREIAAPAAPPA